MTTHQPQFALTTGTTETSQPPLLLRHQEYEVTDADRRQEQQHNHYQQQQLNQLKPAPGQQQDYNYHPQQRRDATVSHASFGGNGPPPTIHQQQAHHAIGGVPPPSSAHQQWRRMEQDVPQYNERSHASFASRMHETLRCPVARLAPCDDPAVEEHLRWRDLGSAGNGPPTTLHQQQTAHHAIGGPPPPSAAQQQGRRMEQDVPQFNERNYKRQHRQDEQHRHHSQRPPLLSPMSLSVHEVPRTTVGTLHLTHSTPSSSNNHATSTMNWNEQPPTIRSEQPGKERASSTQSRGDAPPPSQQFPSHITGSQIVVTSLAVKGVKLIAQNVTYNRNLKVEDTDALYNCMGAVGEGAFALSNGLNSDLLFKKEGTDVRVYKIKVPDNGSIEMVSDHGILVPDDLERQQDLVRRQCREEFKKKGLKKLGYNGVLKRMCELSCIQGFTTTNKRRVGELKRAWQAEVDYQDRCCMDVYCMRMHGTMVAYGHGSAGQQVTLETVDVKDQIIADLQKKNDAMVAHNHTQQLRILDLEKKNDALVVYNHTQQMLTLETIQKMDGNNRQERKECDAAHRQERKECDAAHRQERKDRDAESAAAQEKLIDTLTNAMITIDQKNRDERQGREVQFTETQHGVTGALAEVAQAVTVVGTSSNTMQQQLQQQLQQQQHVGDCAVGKSVQIKAGDCKWKKGTVKKFERGLYTVKLDGGQEVDKSPASLQFLD